MPVYLDDRPIELDGRDLGTLVDAAAKHLGGSGRLLVEVQIDGRVLEPAEIDTRRADPVTGEVHLLSAHPANLVASSIPPLRQRLAQIEPLQNEIAQLLQQDRRQQALAKLPEVLTVWQHAQALLGHALALPTRPLDGLRVDGRDAPALVESLLTQLRALRQFIDAGDSVALADALAYEWPATARLWDAMLASLAQRLPPPTC